MAAGTRRAAHRAPAFVLEAEELCAGFAGVKLAQAWVSTEHSAAFPTTRWVRGHLTLIKSEPLGKGRGSGSCGVGGSCTPLDFSSSPKKTRAQRLKESLKTQN